MATGKLSPEHSRAIREAYAEVLLLAHALQTGNLGSVSAPQIKKEVSHKLKAERAKLLRAGVLEKWVDAIQEPVITLIDESARQCPTPGFKENWPAIQVDEYGHLLMGKTVFEHLTTLRQDGDTPIEVLEVFQRCLAFGLKGKFATEAQEGLTVTIEGLNNDIQRAKLPALALSPDLEHVSHESDIPMVLRPIWIGACAFASLLLLGVILTIDLYQHAHSTQNAVQIEIAEEPAPPLSVDPIENGISD